jgi:hypothetical protein
MISFLPMRGTAMAPHNVPAQPWVARFQQEVWSLPPASTWRLQSTDRTQGSTQVGFVLRHMLRACLIRILFSF